MDMWVRSGSLSLPLSAKGQPRLQPFPPLLARGVVSQHSPVPPLGWKWSLCSPPPPVLLPQVWHVRPFSLSHPPPLGAFGRDASFPRSVPHFSAFLGHRGPLDATQTSRAQGVACVGCVGVSEGQEMPPFPSVLPSASSLCPDPSLVLHPLLPNCKAPLASGSSIPAPPVVPSGSA